MNSLLERLWEHESHLPSAALEKMSEFTETTQLSQRNKGKERKTWGFQTLVSRARSIRRTDNMTWRQKASHAQNQKTFMRSG